MVEEMERDEDWIGKGNRRYQISRDLSHLRQNRTKMSNMKTKAFLER